jgi:hypothetical protein
LQQPETTSATFLPQILTIYQTDIVYALLHIYSTPPEYHSGPLAVFRLMDPGAADEYWVGEFEEEEQDWWVSEYLQDIHSVHDSTGEDFTPMRNTAEAEIPPFLTSASSLPQERTATQLNSGRIPFQKRWEVLRPEIERLYIDENVPLRSIVGIMKEKYDFDAL